MQPDNSTPQNTNTINTAVTSSNLQSSTQPAVNQAVVQPAAQAGYNFVFAGFWDRFLAVFIDGLILSTISFVLNFVVGVVIGLSGAGGVGSSIVSIVSMIMSIIIWILQLAYPIYFIGSRGQTLGKMIMKIKVIKIDSQEVPGYTAAFLRETIGKFLSGIVLGIGYFVSIRDQNKQTWHDKIAHTVVIKLNPQ